MNYNRSAVAAIKSPAKLMLDTTDTSIGHLTNSTTIASYMSNALPSTVYRTPNSIRKPRNGQFHSVMPIVNTPTPPSRSRKIVNPFEAGITERLHLPLIDR